MCWKGATAGHASAAAQRPVVGGLAGAHWTTRAGAGFSLCSSGATPRASPATRPPASGPESPGGRPQATVPGTHTKRPSGRARRAKRPQVPRAVGTPVPEQEGEGGGEGCGAPLLPCAKGGAGSRAEQFWSGPPTDSRATRRRLCPDAHLGPPHCVRRARRWGVARLCLSAGIFVASVPPGAFHRLIWTAPCFSLFCRTCATRVPPDLSGTAPVYTLSSRVCRCCAGAPLLSFPPTALVRGLLQCYNFTGLGGSFVLYRVFPLPPCCLGAMARSYLLDSLTTIASTLLLTGDEDPTVAAGARAEVRRWWAHAFGLVGGGGSADGRVGRRPDRPRRRIGSGGARAPSPATALVAFSTRDRIAASSDRRLRSRSPAPGHRRAPSTSGRPGHQRTPSTTSVVTAGQARKSSTPGGAPGHRRTPSGSGAPGHRRTPSGVASPRVDGGDAPVLPPPPLSPVSPRSPSANAGVVGLRRVTSRSRLFVEQAAASGRVPDVLRPPNWGDRMRVESGRLGSGVGHKGGGGQGTAADGGGGGDARRRGGSLAELRHLFKYPELYGGGATLDDTQVLLLRGTGGQ